MSVREVSAKVGDGDPVTVKYNIPDDLKGLVEAFGEKVVYSNAVGNIVISVQSGIRTQIRNGRSPAEIQKWADSYKPGERAPAATPLDKARRLIPSLSKEQRDALLKELRGGGS